MDEIALRYLLLGLRLGRHVPGFVRSYHGPAELVEAVGSEPLTPAAELHDEAMQLAGLAAELPAETAAQRRRASWLIAQASAIGALARQAGGEEIGYVDLVEELYDIEVQLEPDATFETARRMLDAAIPGGAPLRERIAALESSSIVPAGHAIGLASELAARLRTRTREQLWLPDREVVAFEPAHALPSWIDARYVGGGRSLVLVDLDRPITFASLVEIAAHEGYPGHHVEAATKDELMVGAGHPELTLVTALSPQALVSEGIADIGLEVVMTDHELGAELERLAGRVDQRINARAQVTLLSARRLLGAAIGNAAVALHRDGEPPWRVRSYLAEVALVPDRLLDETISGLGDVALRAAPFAHIEGRRLVSEWLEVHGQTHGLARLLAEQQTPRSLRSGLPAA